MMRVCGPWLGLAVGVTLSACGTLPANESRPEALERGQQSPLRDLFGGGADENTQIAVNRYLWLASQDVLDFMPIESIDPFSGVMSFGYGTPPGGSQPYRATVFVRDAALDARSLRVALATRSGPAAPETVRAIEDAILTRARQIRVAQANL